MKSENDNDPHPLFKVGFVLYSLWFNLEELILYVESGLKKRSFLVRNNGPDSFGDPPLEIFLKNVDFSL